jgi:hypothetical protein
MRPCEGIDKIGVLLNPLFLNKECKKKHIDPFNRLELHRAGVFKVLTIKQEYLNPIIDHQIQIAFAIYELIKQGIINFPDTLMTPFFIYKNHHLFIFNIVALEFYSSWEKEEIKINDEMVKLNLDEAKENDCLYRYIDINKNITDTYYSNDKALTKYDRSGFICYNKQEKDLRDNQIPKNVIYDFSKPIRTEFRLYADNTPWLHWDNLRGTYKDIFNRHIKYLATIYNKFVKGCITINSRSNKYIEKVIRIAEEEDPIRYTGKQLKKRVIIKKSEKPEVLLCTFQEFSSVSKNIENAQNINETMEEVKKNRSKYY